MPEYVVYTERLPQKILWKWEGSSKVETAERRINRGMETPPAPPPPPNPVNRAIQGNGSFLRLLLEFIPD